MNDLYEIMYSLGQYEARNLRNAAHSMTGTEIIASERCVPPFNSNKDYTDWPVGAPVSDEEQVWTLIIPHNAKDYEGRPSGLRSLWGLTHTKDPKRAKPWVDPFGTSGLYKIDECYRDSDGVVYRCLADETNYNAEALPEAWQIVNLT